MSDRRALWRARLTVAEILIGIALVTMLTVTVLLDVGASHYDRATFHLLLAVVIAVLTERISGRP